MACGETFNCMRLKGFQSLGNRVYARELVQLADSRTVWGTQHGVTVYSAEFCTFCNSAIGPAWSQPCARFPYRERTERTACRNIVAFAD